MGGITGSAADGASGGAAEDAGGGVGLNGGSATDAGADGVAPATSPVGACRGSTSAAATTTSPNAPTRATTVLLRPRPLEGAVEEACPGDVCSVGASATDCAAGDGCAGGSSVSVAAR